MRCVQKTTELLAKIMKSSLIPDKNIAEKMIVKKLFIILKIQAITITNYNRVHSVRIPEVLSAKWFFLMPKIWRCSEENQPISLRVGLLSNTEDDLHCAVHGDCEMLGHQRYLFNKYFLQNVRK